MLISSGAVSASSYNPRLSPPAETRHLAQHEIRRMCLRGRKPLLNALRAYPVMPLRGEPVIGLPGAGRLGCSAG